MWLDARPRRGSRSCVALALEKPRLPTPLSAISGRTTTSKKCLEGSARTKWRQARPSQVIQNVAHSDVDPGLGAQARRNVSYNDVGSTMAHDSDR